LHETAKDSNNPVVSLHLHSSTAPPSTTVIKTPKVISWEDATSVLAHINGVSQMMRAKPLLVKSTKKDKDQNGVQVQDGKVEEDDYLGSLWEAEKGSAESGLSSVLDDPSVRALKKSVFEQPEASLVVLVKGLEQGIYDDYDFRWPTCKTLSDGEGLVLNAFNYYYFSII
jgi:hypothetical protein